MNRHSAKNVLKDVGRRTQRESMAKRLERQARVDRQLAVETQKRLPQHQQSNMAASEQEQRNR